MNTISMSLRVAAVPFVAGFLLLISPTTALPVVGNQQHYTNKSEIKAVIDAAAPCALINWAGKGVRLAKDSFNVAYDYGYRPANAAYSVAAAWPKTTMLAAGVGAAKIGFGRIASAALPVLKAGITLTPKVIGLGVKLFGAVSSVIGTASSGAGSAIYAMGPLPSFALCLGLYWAGYLIYNGKIPVRSILSPSTRLFLAAHSLLNIIDKMRDFNTITSMPFREQLANLTQELKTVQAIFAQKNDQDSVGRCNTLLAIIPQY